MKSQLLFWMVSRMATTAAFTTSPLFQTFLVHPSPSFRVESSTPRFSSLPGSPGDPLDPTIDSSISDQEYEELQKEWDKAFTDGIPRASDNPEDSDLGPGPFDDKVCGIRMAEESAIRIAGSVVPPPPPFRNTQIIEEDEQDQELKANDDDKFLAKPLFIDNYYRIRETQPAELPGNAKVVATGVGKEWFKDLGESTEKYVEFSPMEALKNCLDETTTALSSSSAISKLVVNLAGGSDLQIGEIQRGVENFCRNLDREIDVNWNSVGYKDFPEEQCTAVVVAFEGTTTKAATKKEEEEDDKDDEFFDLFGDLQQGLEEGEIYLHGDQYYHLKEEDVVEDPFDDSLFPIMP